MDASKHDSEQGPIQDASQNSAGSLTGHNLASETQRTATGLKLGVPRVETLVIGLILAVALQLVENIFPRIPIFPWLKLGLPQLVILPYLMRYGAGCAMGLTLGRTFLAFVAGGTPLSSVLVATGAGIVATGLIGFLLRPIAIRGLLGWVGLSMALAATHNVTQLILVESLFVDHQGFYVQLTPMLLWSMISGGIIGYLSFLSWPFWNHLFQNSHTMAIPLTEMNLPPPSKKPVFLASLFRLGLILFLPFLRVQILMFVATLVIGLWPKPNTSFRQRFNALYKPMFATWPLLFFLAWLHLFHGEGVFYGNSFVTREGLNEFILHVLRLFNLAALGQRLIAFLPRTWMARQASPSIQAFLYAIPVMAQLPQSIPRLSMQIWKALRAQQPVTGLEILMETLFKKPSADFNTRI